MKSRSTRTVVFVFLICLSLASYLYVNLDARSQAAATEPVEEVSEEAAESNSVILPDVRMLRTVIETGKRVLPAS